MKTITLFIVYFVSFIFFFLMLSTVGMFFTPYLEVITSDGWFIGYTLFFGWWMAMFPAREYYLANEEYFEKVF